MIDRKLPFIEYVIPQLGIFLLTSRPYSYEEKYVDEFVAKHKPGVRFQMTDDKMRRVIAKEIPFHWYSWFPCRNLPVEVAFNCISLLNHYVEIHKHSGRVPHIWLHCDSSSMRAPTFFGLYLM